MGSQVNLIANIKISALIKGSHQKGFQIDRAKHIILVLVERDHQMASQVDSITHKDFSFG